MLTCLVATNPHARAHILSKVGGSTNQSSIQSSSCQRVNQGSKGSSQDIYEGLPYITTLSQSIHQDRSNQESNPNMVQRVNQGSTGIMPGPSEELSMESTISESMKSGNTTQGFSLTTCHRLNNLEGVKIATKFQSVNIKFNQRSNPGSKQEPNLETIHE